MNVSSNGTIFYRKERQIEKDSVEELRSEL